MNGSTSVRSTRHYIDGEWIAGDGTPFSLVDPATERVHARFELGSEATVDRAVQAARRALPAFSMTSRAERTALLQQVLRGLDARSEELAHAISCEMGAPISFARAAQVPCGAANVKSTLRALAEYPFDVRRGRSRVLREPIGVVALITPWNWPLNQIMSKVAPALAAGCTVVLKPSEFAPFDATIVAEIMDSVGLPPGVFNLVHGSGEVAGAALASHPDVDAVSFTGSTRGGVAVAHAAAASVKRVSQELGGKSAYIVLPDADVGAAITDCVRRCFMNAGQSCNAPTRLLLPTTTARAAEVRIAEIVAGFRVGAPEDPATDLGPVANRRQWESVQAHIQQAMAEGARPVCGGPDRPDGLGTGFYVRPTVFCDVSGAMRIWKDEVFGPVLSVATYDTLEEAITLANDSPYGLAGYVFGASEDSIDHVANRLRVGTVVVNGAPTDWDLPFGGYRQSGNGRERGSYGIDEFVEIKGVVTPVGA